MYLHKMFAVRELKKALDFCSSRTHVRHLSFPVISCSSTKSDTQVDPFEHNLSICVEELNRMHQDDNPQDNDNEQSELSQLSRNISGDSLEELLDLDSFEASLKESQSLAQVKRCSKTSWWNKRQKKFHNYLTTSMVPCHMKSSQAPEQNCYKN